MTDGIARCQRPVFSFYQISEFSDRPAPDEEDGSQRGTIGSLKKIKKSDFRAEVFSSHADRDDKSSERNTSVARFCVMTRDGAASFDNFTPTKSTGVPE